MTTDTTQRHRPSCRIERNLIILQVNINGIKNKLEELKLLIHDTHAYIITIQETKFTPKANTTKYITSLPCVPIGCTGKEVGLLLLSTHSHDSCYWGGSLMFPLVVHQPASPPIWQQCSHSDGVCPQIQG